jgi:hypothetical protein
MARAGFYNDNEYRQYPFVLKSKYDHADLPTNLIVDCGFIMGLDSEFNSAVDIVYLYCVRILADRYEFEFRTTAAGAAGHPLIFTRPRGAESWLNESVESASAEDTTFCGTEPIWEGFMVSGHLAEDAGTATATLTFDQERVVEPALIQSLVKSYLRSINVANYGRAVIEGCATDPVSGTSRDIIVQTGCIQGAVAFTAGFNCEISQTDVSRTIMIAPLLGANANTPVAAELCEHYGELPLFDNELPPVIQEATETLPEIRSKFLSGGPACDELITSINGIGGPNVNINGGEGITITANPAAGIVRIRVSDNVISKNC